VLLKSYEMLCWACRDSRETRRELCGARWVQQAVARPSKPLKLCTRLIQGGRWSIASAPREEKIPRRWKRDGCCITSCVRGGVIATLWTSQCSAWTPVIITLTGVYRISAARCSLVWAHRRDSFSAMVSPPALDVPIRDPCGTDDEESTPGGNSSLTRMPHEGGAGRGDGVRSASEAGGDEPEAPRPSAAGGGRAGYKPRAFTDLTNAMNVGRTRDEGRASSTVAEYTAEAKRFHEFLAADDARTLRAVAGETCGLDMVSKRGSPPGPGGRLFGAATVDMAKFFTTPPPSADKLVLAFLSDRSLDWCCSEDKVRKIAAALNRSFGLHGRLGPWTKDEGSPVNSVQVMAARDAHKNKRRRGNVSLKGVDPIRYRDLYRFYKEHFSGKPLREWDQEKVMLYTSMLVGMNLCLRFNELCRLR